MQTLPFIGKVKKNITTQLEVISRPELAPGTLVRFYMTPYGTSAIETTGVILCCQGGSYQVAYRPWHTAPDAPITVSTIFGKRHFLHKGAFTSKGPEAPSVVQPADSFLQSPRYRKVGRELKNPQPGHDVMLPPQFGASLFTVQERLDPYVIVSRKERLREEPFARIPHMLIVPLFMLRSAS